ncbi:MAG: glycerophosphodiester phosphodiesterase [bacterium]|nr:glycerophosphodiester phosphodiesterase [bacterium]
MKSDTLNIAHRGASGYFKENTVKAFKKAVDFGADYTELDARQTKDGKIIVFHDEAIDGFAIESQNCQDIIQRGKTRGIEIPLLCDIVKMFKCSIGLNIEIKGKMDLNLLLSIARPEKNKHILFSSFNADCLKHLKKLCPAAKTGILINDTFKDPLKTALLLNADALILKHYILKRGLLEKAAEKGIKTIVWTVNGVKHMRKYLKWEVWGIITDYPDKLHKLNHNCGKG